MDGELTRGELARLVAELAFSPPDDAVRLALSPASGCEGMDLRLVTELKWEKDGCLSVKLLDRHKLIALAAELTAPAAEAAEDGGATFYTALDSAAKALEAEGDHEV